MTTRIAAILLLLSVGIPAQTNRKDPCDKPGTFCWYGPYQDGSDEVLAQGKHWVAKDQPKKTMQFASAFRCIKRRQLCVMATADTIGGTLVQQIQLLPVTSWTSAQINATSDPSYVESCEHDAYIISRYERSVLLISSPGPMADTDNCRKATGAPRTTVYTLSQ